jgi:hypothetical protein
VDQQAPSYRSYVLEGEMHARVGDEVVKATLGCWVPEASPDLSHPAASAPAQVGPDGDRSDRYRRRGPRAGRPGIGPLLVEMNQQLGRLVEAVEDVGLTGQTAFVLTSAMSRFLCDMLKAHVDRRLSAARRRCG